MTSQHSNNHTSNHSYNLAVVVVVVVNNLTFISPAMKQSNILPHKICITLVHHVIFKITMDELLDCVTKERTKPSVLQETVGVTSSRA